MSQSFNTDAFKATLKILFQDHSPAIPHFTVETIDELSPQKLWDQGIRGVVFDKDNTLTAPYKNEIYPSLVSVVDQFREVFGDQMMIISNSAGTKDDINFADAIEIEEKLNIPVIRHERKKPEGIEVIPELFRCDPSEVLMVGDRLLTDTLFGNRAGMLTVHCGVLTLEGDNKAAMLARNWENSLLRKWKRKGATAPFHQFDKIGLN